MKETLSQPPLYSFDLRVPIQRAKQSADSSLILIQIGFTTKIYAERTVTISHCLRVDNTHYDVIQRQSSVSSGGDEDTRTMAIEEKTLEPTRLWPHLLGIYDCKA